MSAAAAAAIVAVVRWRRVVGRGDAAAVTARSLLVAFWMGYNVGVRCDRIERTL